MGKCSHNFKQKNQREKKRIKSRKKKNRTTTTTTTKTKKSSSLFNFQNEKNEIKERGKKNGCLFWIFPIQQMNAQQIAKRKAAGSSISYGATRGQNGWMAAG
ncbi:MAG: hypothetical protein Q8P67_21990 [archaeon]|nr:hypothetical protein [archaeon]